MGKGSAPSQSSSPATPTYSYPNRNQTLTPGQSQVDNLLGQASVNRMSSAMPWQNFMPQQLYPQMGVPQLHIPQVSQAQHYQNVAQYFPGSNLGQYPAGPYFNPFPMNPNSGSGGTT